MIDSASYLNDFSENNTSDGMTASNLDDVYIKEYRESQNLDINFYIK